MLMTRVKDRKPIAAVVISIIAWLVMDLNAESIEEKIYYILCLIAALVTIAVLVWFVDANRVICNDSDRNDITSNLKNNDDLWQNKNKDV